MALTNAQLSLMFLVLRPHLNKEAPVRRKVRRQELEAGGAGGWYGLKHK